MPQSDPPAREQGAPARVGRQARVDALVIGLATVVAWLVAMRLDAFENLVSFVDSHEDWQLDEIILALGFAGFAGFVFAIRRLADLRREVRRRRSAEAEVHHLAFDDPLTGLPNRRAFVARLERALETAGQGAGRFALMLLDLDRFKVINDLHGHDAGDQALMAVAERVTPLLGPDDMLARLGGDEFALIARSAGGSDEAARLGLQIVSAIGQPLTSGERSIQLGTSLGIALFPSDGTDRSTLMRRADIALYRAKEEGRGDLRFFEPAMDHLLGQRAAIEGALREAIQGNRIGVHFQPLLDLQTDRIIGFEALARWTDPVLGAVPPMTFIQIAEDSGLITALSDQLLRKACRAAVEWPPEIVLSFNISPTQLRDRLLGLRIVKLLADEGLAPQRLEIEVTEGTIVREYEAARIVLADLRTAGIRVALDDFGTGYSSLAQLTQFKFDRIKIDRSFVSRIFEEDEQVALVRTIIGLAHSLGITTTAEGVETEQQAQFLTDEGCEIAQGHLFSAAIPAEEAKRLVAGQGLVRSMVG